MNFSRSLLLIPAASILLAAGIGAGACSSSASVAVKLPGGSTALPAGVSIPSTLGSCSGSTFYVDSDLASDVCGGGTVWLLCDGSAYTQYDCADPGDGWSQETGVTDSDSTDSADSVSSSDGDDSGTSSSDMSDDGGMSSSSDMGDDAGESSSDTSDTSSDSSAASEDAGT